MSAYVPQLSTQGQIQQEFELATTKFAPIAKDGLVPEDLEMILHSLRSDELSETYFRHLPLVHRFIVAEMDTDAPSKRGIGRLADGDPPPRLGAKFRKQLRGDEAQREIGLAAERLVLSGFACQAAFFDEMLEERENDDVWSSWLRHLIPYYNETSDLSSRARNEEQSNLGLTGAMIVTLADHGGDELIEGFERHRIIKGLRKNTWRNARALSYLLLLVGAGRALHHSVSDKLDPAFGSLQSLHLLENYAEKRNKRQMIAEV